MMYDVGAFCFDPNGACNRIVISSIAGVVARGINREDD